MLYQLSYARLALAEHLRKSKSSRRAYFETMLQMPVVGVVGFEPTQSETPDLQSGPALQLRRTPLLSEAHWSSTAHNRASGGIRTPDPLITNQLLWPTELHWLFVSLQ